MRQLNHALSALLLGLLLTAPGCGGEDGSAPGGASSNNASTSNNATGGQSDAGEQPDAATSSADTDTTAPDSGDPQDTSPDEDTGASEDTSAPDDTGASDDTGAPDDTGIEDTGVADTGAEDTGVADSAVEDTNVSDTEAPDVPDDVTVAQVVLPLGETLFMDGDDYLSLWGVEPPEPVVVAERPEGSEATLVGEGQRLTPDRVGLWVLERGDTRVEVDVRDDTLTSDTFLNYNYTPVQPLALVDDATVWVASPPSNAVQRVVLSEEGATAVEMVPTGSWPTTVAHWPSAGLLLVAQTGRDSLGFLNLASNRLEDAIRIGDEPANIVVDDAEGRAFVALSGENAVVEVDLEERRVVGRVEVGRDPRAMAWDAEAQRLYVASLLSSNAHPQGALQETPVPPEEERDVAVLSTAAGLSLETWSVPAGTLLRGLWLAPEGRLVVARTNAQNDQPQVDADVRAHANGLTLLGLEPGEGGRLPVLEEVDLDEQPSSSGPAAAPFSIAPTPDGALLLVTLASGRAVLVLDAETFEEVGRLPAGFDPRGLVFAQGRFWTFVWLDNAVRGWTVPATDSDLEAIAASRVEAIVGADPTPPDIKQGQRIFNDASFSRNGDFACGNCHVDGLTDGMVWNLLLDGDVNTLPFRNIAGTDPFLWGGFLPTLFDFSREVLRLVGANATGEQMELLTRYMQSVTAPPNPNTLPGGHLTEAGERGRAIFNAPSFMPGGGGCADCHFGPLYTGQFTVEGKTEGLVTDVPSLIGVYDTGPWGRQAQWQTIEEMVQYAVGFTGGDLTEQEMSDLIAYVKQIPGDRMFLNSARPLANSRHVWFETPVELAFSSVLAPGQEDHLHFERLEGEAWVAMSGEWVISGRMARFEREGDLPLDTSFRVRVERGLVGTLGRALSDDLEIDFETGSIPEVDISGQWELAISGLVEGAAVGAFLQTRGGYVNGTATGDTGPIDFDHVEGYVSGTQLLLDPFLVLSEFGEFQVEEVDIQLVDEDMDGYADSGTGVLRTIVELDITLTRLSLPNE